MVEFLTRITVAAMVVVATLATAWVGLGIDVINYSTHVLANVATD